MSAHVSAETTNRGSGGQYAATRCALFLLYHELGAEQTAYKYAFSTFAFQQHLELYKRISADAGLSLRPEITFDDGHISNFEHAYPCLAIAGSTARFFITAGWTSSRPGYMTWDHVRQLERAGQTIGAHGWSHALLTHCSDRELDHELGYTRSTLEDKLGVPITTLSLPGGRADKRVFEACRRAGYQQVFSSIPRAERDVAAPQLGRLNLRSQTTVDWLASLFQPGSRVLQRMERQHRVKEAAQRLLGDRLYARLWAAINRPELDASTSPTR